MRLQQWNNHVPLSLFRKLGGKEKNKLFCVCLWMHRLSSSLCAWCVLRWRSCRLSSVSLSCRQITGCCFVAVSSSLSSAFLWCATVLCFYGLSTWLLGVGIVFWFGGNWFYGLKDELFVCLFGLLRVCRIILCVDLEIAALAAGRG